jgi:hypothetical protein
MIISVRPISVIILLNINMVLTTASVVWWCSGSWLHILRSRVRFQALLDFLRSSGSGTGSTQPREYN